MGSLLLSLLGDRLVGGGCRLEAMTESSGQRLGERRQVEEVEELGAEQDEREYREGREDSEHCDGESVWGVVRYDGHDQQRDADQERHGYVPDVDQARPLPNEEAPYLARHT
jgi:hypothetical protein